LFTIFFLILVASLKTLLRYVVKTVGHLDTFKNRFCKRRL